jgi:maleate isomerase
MQQLNLWPKSYRNLGQVVKYTRKERTDMTLPRSVMDIGCLQDVTGWRAEVGMLAPGPGMFREWDLVAPEGVRFSSAILGLEAPNAESLEKMVEDIETEAAKLAWFCDLLCLGCTSGSFIGGVGYDQNLIERIEKASGLPATTTTTCVLELFKDKDIKKIALVGPYIETIFDVEREFFMAHGIETLCVKGLGLSTLDEMEKYSRDLYRSYRLIKDGAKAAPNADCVFATCMATSIVKIADTLEEEIGIPVISSCSATLYGVLKKLRIPDPVYNYGLALRDRSEINSHVLRE